MCICLNRKYHWKQLQKYCTHLFEKAGLQKKDAQIVGESLIMADLRGVDSHGVVRTDIYLSRLKAGMIDLDSKMEIEENGPVALLDGKNRIGSIVGSKALDLAIERTKSYGVSAVGVKHSNHFGTCAYFLQKAIKHDLIMIITSNASQTMPPLGGVRPFIGTNPFSVGVPTGKHPPFILDMATSVVSRGKIIVAAQKGEEIPDNWAVDKYGNPTTDAAEALEGSVLPMGGAKGYGLSMFIDIISGVLTGAGFGKYVNNMYENWEETQNVGHFFIGIDIKKFMPIEDFKKRIDQYFDEIKSEPKAPGVKEIYIPGEIEQKHVEERKQYGIELPIKVEEELRKWGETYHVNINDYLLKPEEVFE